MTVVNIFHLNLLYQKYHLKANCSEESEMIVAAINISEISYIYCRLHLISGQSDLTWIDIKFL